MLNVSQATVNQYESGRRNPKLETIKRVANALGVSTVDLLDSSFYEEQPTSPVKNIPVTLSERMQKLRKSKRYTQKELAHKADVSRESIVKYERGDRLPSVDIAARIANALEVDVNELLGVPAYSKNHRPLTAFSTTNIVPVLTRIRDDINTLLELLK